MYRRYLGNFAIHRSANSGSESLGWGPPMPLSIKFPEEAAPGLRTSLGEPLFYSVATEWSLPFCACKLSMAQEGLGQQMPSDVCQGFSPCELQWVNMDPTSTRNKNREKPPLLLTLAHVREFSSAQWGERVLSTNSTATAVQSHESSRRPRKKK